MTAETLTETCSRTLTAVDNKNIPQNLFNDTVHAL